MESIISGSSYSFSRLSVHYYRFWFGRHTLNHWFQEKLLHCKKNFIYIVMKRIPILFGCMVLFFVGTISMSGQSISQNKDKIDAKNAEEEEEGPIIYKFEPNYVSSTERRREEMAQTRRILDTLDISENKRRKLLRDLYKNGLTKRLSKALIADNKFEDVVD